MRMAHFILAVGLASSIPSTPAWTLDAGDTMAAWKTASPEEKRKLAAEILRRDAPESVIKCLDAASEVPGHADLPIVEVAKVCDADRGEPV